MLNAFADNLKLSRAAFTIIDARWWGGGCSRATLDYEIEKIKTLPTVYSISKKFSPASSSFFSCHAPTRPSMICFLGGPHDINIMFEYEGFFRRCSLNIVKIDYFSSNFNDTKTLVRKNIETKYLYYVFKRVVLFIDIFLYDSETGRFYIFFCVLARPSVHLCVIKMHI